MEYCYEQGRHSNQSHVPWHWLFFCPALKVSTYFGCPVTKTLKPPKWHWLILPPIGANANLQFLVFFINKVEITFCKPLGGLAFRHTQKSEVSIGSGHAFDPT